MLCLLSTLFKQLQLLLQITSYYNKFFADILQMPIEPTILFCPQVVNWTISYFEFIRQIVELTVVFIDSEEEGFSETFLRTYAKWWILLNGRGVQQLSFAIAG